MSETVGYVNVASFILNMSSQYRGEINSHLSEEEISANFMPAERVQEILGHIINTGTEDLETDLYINHFYENSLSAVSSWPSHTQSIAPDGVNFDDIVKQYPQAARAFEEMSNVALDDYNGMVTAEQAYSMLQDAIGGKEPDTESMLYRLVNEGLAPADLARDYPFEGAENNKTTIIDDVSVPTELLPEGDEWQHRMTTDLKSGNGIILSVAPHESGEGYVATVSMLISDANKAPYEKLSEEDVVASLNELTGQAGAIWLSADINNSDAKHYNIGQHDEPSMGEGAQGMHINIIQVLPLSAENSEQVFEALSNAFCPAVAGDGAEYLREASKEEREQSGNNLTLPDAREPEVLQNH